MTHTLTPTTAVASITKRRSTAPFARLMRNPLGAASVVILVVTFLLCMLAPLISGHNPNATDLANTFAPPSSEHWLGTDSVGRDVWSRLLYGGQVTFAAAALAAVVAMLLGIPSGLIAGYYGGRFDTVSYWLADMLLSLPGIVILLAARSVLGPSVWISMVIFGVLFSPGFYRLVRTSVMSVRNELYVDAARVSGLPDYRIIGRHVLYVVRAPLIIQAALIAGIAIAIQAGLGFLGLDDSMTPSWGMMLNDGFANIFRAPEFLAVPAIAIGIVTAALALLGNAVRDALEEGDKPRRRRRRTRPVASPPTAAAATPESPAATRLLTVDHLSIEYPDADAGAVRVVDDVSFHVDRGEVLGIVGESGSGKTQTAFAVLGLLPDEACLAGGRVVFDGIELIGPTSTPTAIEPLRGLRISYVPQEPSSNLDPAFTVGYQLTRPLIKVLKLSKAEARRRALEILETVGIPDPERTFRAYPHEISGGMAQRVLIAGAVSCEPDLIIADEPTTALDVTVQAEVLDLLRDLRERLGISIVMVTHNFGVVADLCDRLVVMQRSRVVEAGDVRQVLTTPREQYTRDLLAATLEGKAPRTLLIDTPEGSSR